MPTEIHHGQPEANDRSAVSAAVWPVNSVQGEMTEYEYECMLEATQAERARQAQEAVWEADPDWLAFRTLCYSDTGTPDAAHIKKGVQHLIVAAQHGHVPAQCRLATELHLGDGRFGIQPDTRKAVSWYQLAAKNGDPIALQSLVVLSVTHPELVEQSNQMIT